MKSSKEDIKLLMRMGEPRAEMFLRWHGKESFFDDQVQAVLEKMHPDTSKPNGESAAIPIAAWSAADSVSLMPSEHQWTRLFQYVQQLPHWTIELLAALMKFRVDQAEKERYPVTALDQLIAWRGERFLYETARQKYTHVEVVKHNTLAKKVLPGCPPEITIWTTGDPPEGYRNALTGAPISFTPVGEKHPSGRLFTAKNPPSETPPPGMSVEEYEFWQKNGCHPIELQDTVEPPKKWMQDQKRSVSPEAYRQAAIRENRRRDKIMLHWTESWLAYMRGAGVTKTTPKE